MDEAENFGKVKETNWSKSHFITSGKFLKLSDSDKIFKLVFCCTLCPSRPEVNISADLSSSGNLCTHMIRKYNHWLSKFESLTKNQLRQRTSLGSISSQCSPAPKKYQIQTILHFERYNARNREADEKTKSNLKMRSWICR